MTMVSVKWFLTILGMVVKLSLYFKDVDLDADSICCTRADGSLDEGPTVLGNSSCRSTSTN